ncbi:SMI1/KNR4 family protein [Streptomyces qinzhouensis]|nr:SMI1/KNR4 family protein [Streptomyces qinzhouensis]
MEELIDAVGRGARWVGRAAVNLYELVGPTPDEEREPGKRKRRGRQRPLTEEELREAEADLGIALPEEYRAYLLDPPADGLLNPLSRTADGWRWATTYDIAYDLLATDFPHPDSYRAAGDSPENREPRQDDFPHDAAFDKAWTAWNAEEEEWQRRKNAGAIVLRDAGSGLPALLAVTGPLKGTVWFDGRANGGPILPLRRSGLPGTFGEWLAEGTPSKPW